MPDRAYVATRKGVFTIAKTDGTWKIDRVAFLSDNASIVARDPRDGALYVSLGHGHFGVKMPRSDDDGETWPPIASPAHPPLPEGAQPEPDAWGKPTPTTTQLVWEITAGGLP